MSADPRNADGKPPLPVKEPKPRCDYMEIAVADLIGFREHCIVPNVSWGLGLGHECDLLVLDSKDRFTEVEIKISMSDLRKDFKKGHGHRSDLITRLVYAVPQRMTEKAKELIPSQHGIIEVRWQPTSERFTAIWVRQCKHRKTQPPSQDRIRKFMHLGLMRIWSLKKALNRKQTKEQ